MQPNDTLLRAELPRARAATSDTSAVEPALTPALAKLAQQERDKAAAARAVHVARQAAIDEAGGTKKWIQAELVQAGLYVADDPASLSDAQKKTYKDRKKALVKSGAARKVASKSEPKAAKKAAAKKPAVKKAKPVAAPIEEVAAVVAPIAETAAE
jgi:glutathione synthase/RimK-type ligase-like ATP-grasp enzyme